MQLPKVVSHTFHPAVTTMAHQSEAFGHAINDEDIRLLFATKITL